MIVDYHEADLQAALRELGTEFEVQTMPVGDVLINSHVFERKTYSDLRASLTDGRYFEQKARLKDSGLTVCFLLEGPEFCNGQILNEDARMKGVFLSLLLGASFKVVVTPNVKQSAVMLTAMEKTLLKWETSPSQQVETTHTQSHLQKKNYKTSNDAAIAAVSCVHGVSVKKARVMLENAGSLQTLCEKESSEIADYQEAGSKRKVGPAVAQKFKDMLSASFTRS